MHALIIEDDPLIAMAIEEILGDFGFTSFDVATSLNEALAAARETCPRLITADVELRPGSGIDAVRTICCNEPIPVIFITACTDKVRSHMPQHPVLNKPFRTRDVEAAVRAVMPLA